MADLRISKAAIKSGVGAISPGSTGKARPSAFDSIRSKIAGQVAADLKVPPAPQVNTQQIASIEANLNKRLETSGARTPQDFFRVEMKDSRVALDKLTNAVDKLPRQGAFSPIRQRLDMIEQQYQRSGDLIHRVGDMDPKSLLNVQLQLHQLAENMELLSKVVDQVSSGVKTIMQTNV
jgi:hypothetical protein